MVEKVREKTMIMIARESKHSKEGKVAYFVTIHRYLMHGFRIKRERSKSILDAKNEVSTFR